MIRWAVHRPAVIWAASVAIIVSGGIAFSRLALATKTTVEFPRLQIRTGWTGASAELMEMYITAPIEAAVQGVRGVRKTESKSSEGTSGVIAHLDPDADVQLTRLAILERMEVLRTDSAFPDRRIQPTVGNYVPEALQDQPLLIFSVDWPVHAGALQKIVNEQVVPRIAAVPGVGGAVAQSTIRMGVAVIYDPQLLRQLQIRPEVLTQALGSARMVRSLGDETLGASVRNVVLRDEPRALDELAALPIRSQSGRIFRLGELARLTPDEDAQGAFNRIDGMPSMTMYVYREPTADAIETADAVLAGIDRVKPSLPPGIGFSVARNESVELGRKLTDLKVRGLIAFAAVTLVLLVAFRNIRATALVMGSAVVAIAGTALGLYIFEIPANMLTLAGLGMGVGILVQDAIIVVDRLATVPDTPDARAAAARRILPAILGATLTTIVVLIPFLYLQGNARAAFFPFAAAFALALVWSVLRGGGGGSRDRARARSQAAPVEVADARLLVDAAQARDLALGDRHRLGRLHRLPRLALLQEGAALLLGRVRRAALVHQRQREVSARLQSRQSRPADQRLRADGDREGGRRARQRERRNGWRVHARGLHRGSGDDGRSDGPL